MPWSSPLKWVISSAGRASALQAEGRRFDPVITHHFSLYLSYFFNEACYFSRLSAINYLVVV